MARGSRATWLALENEYLASVDVRGGVFSHGQSHLHNDEEEPVAPELQESKKAFALARRARGQSRQSRHVEVNVIKIIILFLTRVVNQSNHSLIILTFLHAVRMAESLSSCAAEASCRAGQSGQAVHAALAGQADRRRVLRSGRGRDRRSQGSRDRAGSRSTWKGKYQGHG